MTSFKSKYGYLIILGAGAALAGLAHISADRSLETARQHFIAGARADSRAALERANAGFKSIYENLRTLTLLPGMRDIDRHAANLSAEGRETVAQIYGNLSADNLVSELYVFPRDFDPAATDRLTGERERPILNFKSPDAAGALTTANRELGLRIASDGDGDALEQEEYAAARAQMQALKRAFPDMAAFPGQNPPILSSAELGVAGSATEAETARLIFAEPIYDGQGDLKGAVAALVPSERLRHLLPAQNFALYQAGQGYATRSLPNSQGAMSAEWLDKGLADPSLVYSETFALEVNDPNTQWRLWAGFPDSAFFDGVEARGVRYSEVSTYCVIALLTLAAIFAWMLYGRNTQLAIAMATGEQLERRVAERTAEVSFLATHDVLTGLANRSMLGFALEQALANRAEGAEIAVFCLDLDRFKDVNDTLGHPFGDALLKAAASRMRAGVGGRDIVARIGGDEFVVVAAVNRRGDADGIMARLVAIISDAFEIDGQVVSVGVSIGAAFAPSHGEDADTLIRNADVALYSAKANGRGRFCAFDPQMERKIQDRRRLEQELRQAVVERQFSLYYQAQVDARTEKVRAYEALLRWNHPTRGIVPPDDFVSLAEEIGVIGTLGEWVIGQACADAAKWPRDVGVAINISPAQFKQKGLLHCVVLALAGSGLAAHRLELEITESVLLADVASNVELLHKLRALGVRIAMDDFGTGYSSLSYLRAFPFDKIKIDRSFLKDLAASKDNMAIIKAVAGLGASLGMATTAEGVETQEQLDIVRRLGCDEIQGYFYSKPQPASDPMPLTRLSQVEAA